MKALKNFLHFILALVLLVGVSCKSKTTNKTDEKGQNVAQTVRVSGSSIKVASEFIEAGLQGDFNRLAELCCQIGREKNFPDRGPYTSYEDVKNLNLGDIGYIEKIIREENSEADPENLKLVVLRAKVSGEISFYCLLVFKTPAGYKIYTDNYYSWKYLWEYPAIKDSLASKASDFYSQFKKEEENLLVPHNKAKEEAFLKENAKKPGVKVTASGLQYKVITEGSGPLPKESDTVKFHSRVTMIDGTEIENTYKRNKPIVSPLKHVLKGLIEALQLMKVGSKWQFFLPSSLAFGESGKFGDRQVIGPNATLIIEVELLGIE